MSFFSKLRNFKIQGFFSHVNLFLQRSLDFFAYASLSLYYHESILAHMRSFLNRIQKAYFILGKKKKKDRLNVSDKQNVLHTKCSRTWTSVLGKIMSRHCFSIINNEIPSRWKRTSLGLKMKVKR